MTYIMSVTYDPYDMNEMYDDEYIESDDIESIAEMNKDTAIEDPAEFFNIYRQSSNVDIEENIEYEIINSDSEENY